MNTKLELIEYVQQVCINELDVIDAMGLWLATGDEENWNDFCEIFQSESVGDQADDDDFLNSVAMMGEINNG